MATVAERISDGAILRLIQTWLKARHGSGQGWNEAEYRRRAEATAKVRPRRCDLTAAGQSIPGITGQEYGSGALQQRLGARIVRYADDISFVCQTWRRKADGGLAAGTGTAGLTLKNEDENSQPFEGKFDFSGFSILGWGKSRRTGKRYATRPAIEEVSEGDQKDRVSLSRSGREHACRLIWSWEQSTPPSAAGCLFPLQELQPKPWSMYGSR